MASPGRSVLTTPTRWAHRCYNHKKIRVNGITGHHFVRGHIPLDRLTADQLRERAREYREMAKTATSDATRDGLLRLADEFEALARSKKPVATARR
jgi:hypothetical protein